VIVHLTRKVEGGGKRLRNSDIDAFFLGQCVVSAEPNRAAARWFASDWTVLTRRRFSQYKLPGEAPALLGFKADFSRSEAPERPLSALDQSKFKKSSRVHQKWVWTSSDNGKDEDNNTDWHRTCHTRKHCWVTAVSTMASVSAIRIKQHGVAAAILLP